MPVASKTSIWTVSSGLQAGAVHADGVCQDRIAFSQSPHLIVAAVADGAGSTTLGGVGAEIVANSFVELASALGKRPEKCTELDLQEIFAEIQDRVSRKADVDGNLVSEYSSTLVGIAVGRYGAVVMQVGDGIAVVKIGDVYAPALKPIESETLNTTTFVTSHDARAKLLVSRINRNIDAFFLMSDGLQHLVIDTKTTNPHVLFFDSLLSKISGQSAEEASAWIESVLASRQVTSRTDDDTSLLVARRTP